MGFFDKLRGEFIDIIQWLDPSEDTLVYRFERYQNEIKNGAQLTVREGQVAVFINEGQIADVFTPGMYSLTTQNLPILSTLKGWKFGFNSPFQAEVYFISTRNITAQRWGTKNPITLSDSRFGMIELRAFGTYVIRVKDAPVFIREIVGTDGYFTSDKIAEQLKSMIVTRFTNTIGKSNLPVESYAGNISDLSLFILGEMAPEFEKYGIEITNFLIENISMPEEIKKEIFELSRLNTIDLNKLTQMKTAKAIENASLNEGGTAGAGIGMGMGIGMAGQMTNMMANQQQAQQPQAGAPVPPPIPQATTYFVAQNGQQTGPFEAGNLRQQAGFTRESLVWHSGLAGWTPAGDVAELKPLFDNMPPPIPGS